MRSLTFSPLTHWDDDVRRVALLRLDSLAFGVLVSCFRHSLYKIPRSMIISGTVLGLIVSIQLLLNDGSSCDYLRKTVIYPLTSSCLSIVVALSALITTREGCIATLATKTSLYSYSFYLFHWPIWRYTDKFLVSHKEHPLLLILVGLALLYLFGYVVFRFIEEPIMRRRPIHAK